MANPTFNTLKLKTNTDVKEIVINDKTIAIKQYLPLDEKINLIECAIQAADGGTVMNELAIEAFFELYVIFKYTNIQFTEKQMENLSALYDAFESNGVIDQVITAIPRMEYTSLLEALSRMRNEYTNYRNSIRAVVEQFTLFAPNAAEDMRKTIDGINFDNLQQVMDLANATGMNYETNKG